MPLKLKVHANQYFKLNYYTVYKNIVTIFYKVKILVQGLLYF
jgi:hypothetical protein